MWFRTIGAISDDVMLLGHIDVPIFLLKTGAGFALIEGGVLGLAPLVLAQLRQAVPDLSAITHWIITHAHYDHCGLLTHILPHLPSARVYASSETRQAFSRPAARRVISSLNDTVAESLWPERAAAHPLERSKTALEDISVTELSDRETLHMGPHLRLKVFFTPGHSRCLLSLVDLERSRAFVSDTLGEFISPGNFCPLAFDSLGDYRRSIRCIEDLQAATLFFAHNGVLHGRDALQAPRDALAAVDRLQDEVLRGAAAGRTPEELCRALSARYRQTSESFVPAELHLRSMQRMAGLMLTDSTHA